MDNHNFSNVSEIQSSISYRKENTQVNLNGGYLIDRVGNYKTALEVKINMLSPIDLQVLKNAYINGITTVKYYDDFDEVTKQMTLKSFDVPSPIYIGENTIVYTTISIKLEEF